MNLKDAEIISNSFIEVISKGVPIICDAALLHYSIDLTRIAFQTRIASIINNSKHLEYLGCMLMRLDGWYEIEPQDKDLVRLANIKGEYNWSDMSKADYDSLVYLMSKYPICGKNI